MSRFLLAALMMTAIVANAAFAQSVEEMVAPCVDCHGENGLSSDPTVPILAGHSDFVFTDWFFAFQDEIRPCRDLDYPEGSTESGSFNHCAHVADWTEDQMIMLGEEFAARPFPAQAQDTDPALVTAGKALHDELCEKCHTDGGTNPDDDAGILAGQWKAYLQMAMDDYAAGTREMPDKMAEKMEGLSADDAEALVEYYASQGGG